jgi:hypothetical protein
LMVSAWLWQRIELMRTHNPSIGMAAAARDLVALGLAFHSSLLWPLPRSSRSRAAGSRRARSPELGGRQVRRPQRGGHAAVDVEDRRCRSASGAATARAGGPSAR